jgi:aminoglycoside phosphotransferase (APT) family kinase protein
MRVRDPDENITPANGEKVLHSEVATMKFLKRKTTIPVPTVFAYDSSYDNAVGQPYILMEAMTGKNLWGGGLFDFIPDVHKEKVYE